MGNRHGAREISVQGDGRIVVNHALSHVTGDASLVEPLQLLTSCDVVCLGSGRYSPSDREEPGSVRLAINALESGPCPTSQSGAIPPA